MELAYLGLALSYAMANFAYILHVEHRITVLESKLDTLIDIIDKASIIKGE